MAPSQAPIHTWLHLTHLSHTGWSYFTWPVILVFNKGHSLPPSSSVCAKVKLKPFKFYTFWHIYSNVITNINPLLNAIFVEVNFTCKYDHFLNNSVTTHFQTLRWTGSESWKKSSPENISHSTVMWLWFFAKVATNWNTVSPMAWAYHPPHGFVPKWNWRYILWEWSDIYTQMLMCVLWGEKWTKLQMARPCVVGPPELYTWLRCRWGGRGKKCPSMRSNK